MQLTENAFVIIHFGKNKMYLEMEIYFAIMLRKYTNMNIIYMYSVIDTPQQFVDAIYPFVDIVKPYNDQGITVRPNTANIATNYNFSTLRTCNFMYAYLLTEYKKICVIESDILLMGNMDTIFDLHAPSANFYVYPFKNKIVHKKKEILAKECSTNEYGVWINGGVLLIKPSVKMYEECVRAIPKLVECRYPNEALFQYINKNVHTLPVKYNLTHYKIFTIFRGDYHKKPKVHDILALHFNETAYKYLDIIRDNWLDTEEAKKSKKYSMYKYAINHFKDTVYNEVHPLVNHILENVVDTDTMAIPPPEYIPKLRLGGGRCRCHRRETKRTHIHTKRKCRTTTHKKRGDV